MVKSSSITVDVAALPASLSIQASSPVVPLSGGPVTITGTTSAPDGTNVAVYENGVEAATTVSASGKFSVQLQVVSASTVYAQIGSLRSNEVKVVPQFQEAGLAFMAYPVTKKLPLAGYWNNVFTFVDSETYAPIAGVTAKCVYPQPGAGSANPLPPVVMSDVSDAGGVAVVPMPEPTENRLGVPVTGVWSEWAIEVALPSGYTTLLNHAGTPFDPATGQVVGETDPAGTGDEVDTSMGGRGGDFQKAIGNLYLLQRDPSSPAPAAPSALSYRTLIAASNHPTTMLWVDVFIANGLLPADFLTNPIYQPTLASILGSGSPNLVAQVYGTTEAAARTTYQGCVSSATDVYAGDAVTVIGPDVRRLCYYEDLGSPV